MRISDWSSDVCSSDLERLTHHQEDHRMAAGLLEGKAAVISGIGPGMGRDIALLFAEHGADVVLGARTLERCEAVAEEVRALGGRSEERRVGKEGFSTCRSRWAPVH